MPANSTLNARVNVRVVELDPATLATRQFLYSWTIRAQRCSGADDTRADKVGDMVATPEGFLWSNGTMIPLLDTDLVAITKKVYAFRLAGATQISGLGGTYDRGRRRAEGPWTQMTAAELHRGGCEADHEDTRRGPRDGRLRQCAEGRRPRAVG